MDLYLVGPEVKYVMNTLINRKPTNFLFSYLRQKEAEKWFSKIKPSGKIFIDSGAFTIWTQGESLNTDEYIEWLNRNSQYIDLCGQVDSIPGTRFSIPTSEQVENAAQESWNNYLYMRSKVNKKNMLLYTFHVGEPISFLKQALEWKDEEGKKIEYMALGGMVSKTREQRDKFLDLCYHIIKSSSNPEIKIHAFGMTDYKLLQKYPITSADSTSWIMTGAMGSIMQDEGVLKVSIESKNSKDFYSNRYPKEVLDRIERNLKKYGLTFKEIEEENGKRKLYNAFYMQDKVENLKQNYKKTNRLF